MPSTNGTRTILIAVDGSEYSEKAFECKLYKNRYKHYAFTRNIDRFKGLSGLFAIQNGYILFYLYLFIFCFGLNSLFLLLLLFFSIDTKR